MRSATVGRQPGSQAATAAPLSLSGIRAAEALLSGPEQAQRPTLSKRVCLGLWGSGCGRTGCCEYAASMLRARDLGRETSGPLDLRREGGREEGREASGHAVLPTALSRPRRQTSARLGVLCAPVLRGDQPACMHNHRRFAVHNPGPFMHSKRIERCWRAFQRRLSSPGPDALHPIRRPAGGSKQAEAPPRRALPTCRPATQAEGTPLQARPSSSGDHPRLGTQQQPLLLEPRERGTHTLPVAALRQVKAEQGGRGLASKEHLYSEDRAQSHVVIELALALFE